MIRWLGYVVLVGVLTTGCDNQTAVPDVLGGKQVATMAERQLEAQNPRMSPGVLSCPDLDFKVGESVRCLRTAELSEGRVVKVAGTVTVTSRASGGRLRVVMDDHAQEFGLSGEYLATALRAQYTQRFHHAPSRLQCPYLRGALGSAVSCRLEVGGTRRHVDVVVTAVDPAEYRTGYRFTVHAGGS